MKTLHTIYTNFAKRLALIITLLTLGVTTAWAAEETLTITYDSFKTHTSSYTDQQWSTESSDGTSISGSATVCFTNSQDYIQLKNNHPAFRNTTALPGALKSITLTRQATGSNRQITMYVSTSLITKDNYTSATSLGAKQVTTSGVTWTLTSNQQAAGYKYFYFHGSSNTCYLDNVVVTYAASCTNSVAVSAGTNTNVSSMSFSSSSIATCSSNAADRQVTVTVTPNTGYEMTSSARLTFTKTSGTATATYVSGPTASGSSYQFVYQFHQNDNGEGAFSASCTAKTSTVSFNQNGGEGGQTASVTATYGQNMPTPITLPTRYGHTFVGYYDGAGGTGTQYYTAEGTSARTWNKTSASATLYAKWTEKALTNYRTSCITETTVYLHPNFGSESATQITTGASTYTVPDCSFIRDGYTFSHWDTKADDSGIDYDPGDNIDLDGTDVNLYAQWTSNKTATSLSWSPATYTATIDAVNTFPELTKTPADLSPIAYSSLNTDVAMIDANGNITLVAAGTTTITATFNETVTHAFATASYTLTVNPSNCRWVEVIDNTTLEDGDEVVIAMEYNGFLYALPNDGGDNTPVLVTVTEADILSDRPSENLIWDIEKESTYQIFHPINSTDNLFFNKADDGVRIGSTQANANVYHKFVIDDNHLANIGTTRYLGIGTVGGEQKWKAYPTTTGNLEKQTLKFYKRECLDASKVWVEGNLINVTCTQQLPQQLAKDGSITLIFSAADGYALPNEVSVTNATKTWDQETGKLTISNPTDNVLVTINAVKLHTITWMVGSNSVLTEKVANTTGVTQTPDDPANGAIGECANAFMGWSEINLGSAEGQSAPIDLFTTVAEAQSKIGGITENKTFYAVFATKGSGGIAQGTVLWAENFEHFGSKTPSEAGTGTGTTIYGDASITYSQSSNNTKGYNDNNNAGGTLPELLLQKGGSHTWTIAGIPTGGATKMTLSFLSNRTDFNVTSSTTGITINGSGTAWNIEADSDVTNFTLTIKNTSSDKNARLDNVSVVVAEGGVSYSNYVTNCCNTPAPTNGAYTSVSGTEIKLTWDDAANTNYYHITGGNLSDEGVYSTNKYCNITGLTECEEYTFNVAAVDGCESAAIAIIAQPYSGAKTVTFNPNGGAVSPTSFTTSCDKKSTTLPTPTYSGYRFMGWFTAGGTEIDDNPYTPTEDITLFAHWEKEYTVTYDLQGGTASPVCSGDKYIEGEIVIICTSTPIKSGYKFTGWTYSPVVTITNGQFTMPASNVTITAEFVARAVTNIEVATNTHRVLMQGSAFIGEQIRVTYDNGETELLEWSNSKLTFTGHNTNELGVQTVTVTYTGEGTAHTQYDIEVIDGLGITFWDGNYTEVVKYEPGDLVDVDSRIGQNICSGWEFAGWSETQVANESEEYVPVHNFNATDAKVLYAVYVKKKAQWTTIVTADEAKSGAKYVLAYNRYGTYYALTSSVKDVNYLAGKVVTSTEGELNSFDVYYLSAEPTADLIWELISTDENGKWYLYNKNTAKYIDLSTQGQIHLTDLPSDKLQMESGYNDSQIRIASSTVPTYYLSWDNSYTRYNTFASKNSQEYWYTKDEEFTSTPPCSPLSATFHGNGGIVTVGVNSGDDLTITEPTRDAGITTPTASFADCNGKSWTFVGWSREEIDVTRVPVLTTDLLHDGGGNKHYYIQEDGEEFWAVYTNIGDPETKYGTITFTDDDVTTQYENAKTITKSVTAMGDYDFELYHVSDASSLGIQFDHNSTPKGYIKNITSLGKINSISLNDFQVGDIDDVKVYVGNTSDAINILLTEADLQQTGNTYTYYPQKNYAYVKIEANGYCGITSISIDFGKGTQIWATTPDCSTITLSGDELYVTSTNGQSIRAAERLTVKAVQLESKAKVVISSNSSGIYFSDVQDANFTQAVKPTKTLTLTTDVDGNLSATEIYVHYRPSVDGTGIPEDVVVSANLETPNPSITDDHTIHVRNLPADFVIAAKVNDIWYALPNNCNSTSIVNGLPIDVDNEENPSIATFAPAEAKWGLKPVYTTSGVNDRYGDFGEYFVFAETNTGNAGLLYSNKDNAQVQTQGTYSGISGYTEISRYEWIPTTTDLTTYQLASAADSKLLSINVNGVFGTHSQLVAENKLRLLPIEAISQHAEMQVVEWREDAVVFMYTGNPTHKVTATLASISTTKSLSEIKFDHGVYKMPVSNLLNNEGKSMSIRFYDGSTEVARTEIDVPVIVNSEMNTSSLSTMAKVDYETIDVVILNGGKLTATEEGDAAKYRFRNVTVYGGGKLVIGEGKYLSMASIILRAGGFADDGAYEYVYPQFELKGNLTNTAGKFYYDYITDYDHWYHLVLPFAGDLGTIKYPTEFYGSNVTTSNSGSWIIKRYAGDIRATGNYKAWVDIETDNPKPTATTSGVGYIFWGAPKKVKVNGVENRQQWGIQRISMTKGAGTARTEEIGNKKIQGLSSHKDVANNSGKVNDQGWNLIGNPYMVNLTGLNSESLKPGKLVEVEDAAGNWTGQWKDNEDGFRYVTIPSDHFDTYTAQRMTAFTEANPMIAGRAFFIQLEDDDAGVTFSAANRASLLAARVAANEPTTDIETGIVLSNETLQDEVNFWIKDGKTNDYEYNADYPKTPNTNNFNIYGVHTNGDLSWVATGPEYAAESMPIGYQVPAAGTYMLSLSEIYNSDGLEALYVTDHALSPEVTVDIMSESYEFSVNQAETNNERFTVSVRVKAKTENGATGLGNVGADGEQIHKFIYQDKMYILHHGVIYDATGKRVITINK